jgi:hypothetical protein
MNTTWLNHFDLRERIPQGGVPVKGGSGVDGNSEPACPLRGARRNIMARKKWFSWMLDFVFRA